MANVNFTTLDVLLQAAQQKLLTDGIFTNNCVMMSLKPDEALDAPPGDQFCVITPGKQIVDKPIRVGAGRVLMEIHGEMTTTLWVRLALDRLPYDDQWLLQPSYGCITAMTAVINSLELYQPHAGSNWLMPMGFELQLVEMFSKEKDKVGWGAVQMLWSLEYSMQLTPNAFVS